MSFTALVTGTNRGTGFAIARRLRRETVKLASLNRTLDGPRWLNASLCDLGDPESIRRACGQVLLRFDQKLDLCVLNAAQRVLKPVEEMSEAEWDSQVAVNFSSVFRVVKHVLPALKEARGMLVFLSSHAADHYFEGGSGYCATKAALHAFAEVVGLEVRAHGVRSSIVSPGAIRNRSYDRSVHKIAPDDVADLVWSLVNAGGSLIVSNVEIRPRNPVQSALLGMQRLQVL
jgi:NAD(P)-dependent dehydrogenase (short-subunit alcohol dehydrogenase family)